MSDGICAVCKGAGWLLTFPPEWWQRPCCGGSGARFMYGPPFIGPGDEMGQAVLGIGRAALAEAKGEAR